MNKVRLMSFIKHNFPKNKKTFALLMPRIKCEYSLKKTAHTVQSVKHPDQKCTVSIIEVLLFDLDGLFNQFPDWMSRMFFDQPAAKIKEVFKQRHPNRAEKNEFEIWIAVKKE